VVGGALTKANTSHACLWDHAPMVDLGTLPGGRVSKAFGINDNGWIVGDSDDANGDLHVVVWIDGKIRDLGSSGHYKFCIPKGINNQGVVFGDVYSSKLYLWDQQHGMRFVNLSKYPLYSAQRAVGINDNGVIAAIGVENSAPEHHYQRLFLIKP